MDISPLSAVISHWYCRARVGDENVKKPKTHFSYTMELSSSALSVAVSSGGGGHTRVNLFAKSADGGAFKK